MQRAFRFAETSVTGFLGLGLMASAFACDADDERHARPPPPHVVQSPCPTGALARAAHYDTESCPDVSALVDHLATWPADATALRLTRELARLAPDRPDVWGLIARFALAMDDRALARAALHSAVRLREPIGWDGPLVAWGLSDTPCTSQEDLTRDLLEVRASRGLTTTDDLLVLGWDEADEDVVRAPPVIRPRPMALRGANCHRETDASRHGVVAFDGARDVPLTLARATLGDAEVLLFAETPSERDLAGRLCRTFAAQGAPVLVEVCGGLTSDHRSYRVLDRRRRVLVPEHPVRVRGGQPELLWVESSGALRLVWVSVGAGRCGAHQTWVTRLDGSHAIEGRVYHGGARLVGCDAVSSG